MCYSFDLFGSFNQEMSCGQSIFAISEFRSLVAFLLSMISRTLYCHHPSALPIHPHHLFQLRRDQIISIDRSPVCRSFFSTHVLQIVRSCCVSRLDDHEKENLIFNLNSDFTSATRRNSVIQEFDFLIFAYRIAF